MKSGEGVGRRRVARSLGTVVMLLFLLVGLGPMLARSVAGYFESNAALEQTAFDRLMVIREARAGGVETYYRTVDSLITAFAAERAVTQSARDFGDSFRALGAEKARALYLHKPDLVDAGDYSAYSSVHGLMAETFNGWRRAAGVHDVMLLDMDGNVVFSCTKEDHFGTNLVNGPYVGTNLATLAAMMRAQKGDRTLAADYAPFEPSGGLISSFLARPVMVNDSPVALLVAQFPIDVVNKIMTGDLTGLGATGESFMVGADFTMRSDSRFVKESTILKQKVKTESTRLAASGKSGAIYDTDYLGRPVLTAFRPVNIGGVSWYVVAEMEQSEALAMRDRLSRVSILLTIIGAGLAIIAGFWLSRPLIGGLRSVSMAAEGLAVGDLTKRAPIRGANEVSAPAAAFNEMADGLSGIVRNIVDNATKLSSGTTQISASANEMSAGAESQAMQVIRTSTTMEEMSAAIQEIAHNARSTAEASQAAVDRARQATARIEAVLIGLGQANESLQELRQRSAEIDRLVTLIADIAAQTNLLALNAAIEAAGAGAAGARFDVVAEEIRKLAQRAGASSAEISVTVARVRQETEVAAQRMSDTSGQAAGAGQSLTDIVEAIASIRDMVTVITQSTGEQAAAAEEVAEALQVISRVSQQTVEAARETARTTDDLSRLAEGMRASVQKFKLT